MAWSSHCPRFSTKTAGALTIFSTLGLDMEAPAPCNSQGNPIERGRTNPASRQSCGSREGNARNTAVFMR